MGISFIKASVVFFLLVVVDVIITHAMPFVRDCLDTPDPQFLGYKLTTLAISTVIYLILTLWVCKVSIKNFEKQDL